MKITEKISLNKIFLITYYMVIMIGVYFVNIFLQKHTVKIYNSNLLYASVFVLYLFYTIFLRNKNLWILYIVVILILFLWFLLFSIKFSFLYVITILFVIVDALISFFIPQNKPETNNMSNNMSNNSPNNVPNIPPVSSVIQSNPVNLSEIMTNNTDWMSNDQGEFNYNDYIIVKDYDNIFTENVIRRLTWSYQ